MEPINVKMKMADPEQMDALMTAAIRGSGWLGNEVDEVVSDIVRAIHAGLAQAACIIFQVDNDAT